MTTPILSGIRLHRDIEEYVESFRDFGGWPDEDCNLAVDMMGDIERHLAHAEPKTEEERLAYINFALTLWGYTNFGARTDEETFSAEISHKGYPEQAVIFRAMQMAAGQKPTKFPANAFKRRGA